MSGGKAALEALEALLSGAKRVDLGDMTRPVTAARREALEAMLPKADDWGWKGGKEYEITGGDYRQHMREQLADWNDLSPETDFLATIQAQLLGSKYPAIAAAIDDVDRVYKGFSRLEQADVPREWTGKVMNAILQASIPVRPRELSNIMRPMTNDQRETFVALLPDWSGSLDDLADAARNL